MTRKTRPVSWIRAALREFETFPEGAQSICLASLTIAAEGGKADIAKPMSGLGSGVFEIALAFRGDVSEWSTHYRSATKFGFCTRSRKNLHRVSRHLSAK